MDFDKDRFGEERISIVDLLRQIYRSKWILLTFIGVFFILGFLLYSNNPKEFNFKVKLLPEANSGLSAGGLGALGINLGSRSNKERTLDPVVYEDIIRSAPFINKIISKKYFFPSIEKELTLRQYLESYTEFTVMEKIVGQRKKKSIVNTTTRDSILDEDVEPQAGRVFPNEVLKMESKAVIRDFNDRILYNANVTTGIIEISLDLQDATVGAEALQNIVTELTNITLTYEGQKRDVSAEQLDQQIAEKKSDYNRALNALSAFRNQNRNAVNSVVETELLKLQNEVGVAQSMVNTLIQQREMMNVNPTDIKMPIAVIEPVQYAGGAYKPQLFFYLVISGFLGTLFGCIFILIRKSLLIIIK